MKTCPYCNTERPLSEFRKPGDRKCRKCHAADCAAWRAANKERLRADSAARSRAWYAANKERHRAGCAARYEANPALKNRKRKEWLDANPGWRTENNARRRAGHVQCPAWANRDAILGIYRDACEFREAGIPATVDHIIPLRGKLVSGLHCEANLTIKLSRHNGKKGTKFDPATFDNNHPLGV